MSASGQPPDPTPRIIPPVTEMRRGDDGGVELPYAATVARQPEPHYGVESARRSSRRRALVVALAAVLVVAVVLGVVLAAAR